MTVEFKQGDLEPSLIIDLVGEGANLNSVVSWRVLGRLRGAAALLFDDTAASVVVNPTDATKAVVTHTWTTPQTATLGLLLVEVEATWPGGRKQTFPGDRFIEVRIAADLDP